MVDNSVFRLSTENSLNKVLKKQRQSKERIHILYTSLWDDYCNELLLILDQWYEKEEPVYVVDSFDMPHAFVVFSVSQTPTLVSLGKNGVVVESYLSSIYTALGLE